MKTTLWTFASGLYGLPGVAEELLEAQDRHGADPNFLLTLLFFCRLGIDLDAQRLAALDLATRPLKRDWLLPVRSLRQSIPKIDAGSNLASARHFLLQSELEFEREAQSIWIDTASAWHEPNALTNPSRHFHQILAWLGSPISVDLADGLCVASQSTDMTALCMTVVSNK